MTAAAVSESHDKDTVVYEHGVPVIDLSNPNESIIIQQIANACSTFGFFQVTHHGISPLLLNRFRQYEELYFGLSHETKMQYKRHEKNSRGFFNDELTKQRRDWKEALDVGVPGSRNWDLEDDDERNACLDGFNQFPTSKELPEFRKVVVEYFKACAELSDRLAILMTKGLVASTEETAALLESLRTNHTSYLRMNYYPPCSPQERDNGIPPLGISPHRDAGFLTVLAQDDACHSLQVCMDDTWVTVKPVKGALTINTGDMAMMFSNGKYRAPLHRVRTDPMKKRYSAPFFYNPGYDTLIKPLNSDGQPKYRPCLWGYFRAVRFAGDLTDLGVEIQTSDYLIDEKEKSHHLEKQDAFRKMANFHEPFSVEKYRPLLQGK